MRHRALFAATFALLVACDAVSTPVEPALTAVAQRANGVGTESATTVTTNEQIDITLFVFVPCAAGGAGEVIEVSGPLHILSHVTISNSGNFHFKIHFQPQGISGVGLTTGDKYQATGVTQEEFNSNAPLPITDTYVNNFRMIGQGPGNNFLVHQNFHITINANGDVTSLHNNSSVECK
jgi:hypothetical protein